MTAEELKHKAAIFLEEKWNISGDTQVELDHNLEDLPEEAQQGGAVDLHDIMADFVTEHDQEIIKMIDEMIDEEKEIEDHDYPDRDAVESSMLIINKLTELRSKL